MPIENYMQAKTDLLPPANEVAGIKLPSENTCRRKRDYYRPPT